MSDIFLNTFSAKYDEDVQLIGLAWNSPGYHSNIESGSWVHPIRDSLDYALFLYKTAEHKNISRANAIVAKVLPLQNIDPTSHTYGIWSWLYEEPLGEMSPPDWNWADFCGVRLAQIWKEFSEYCDPALIKDIEEALYHDSMSSYRRNVGPEYTNIAIMGAALTLAAGEILNDRRLIDYGLK